MTEPWDKSEALELVDDDDEFLAEIIILFLESREEMLEQIREAVESRDAAALERTAHTLKGAVNNFAAKPATDAALELQIIGNENRLDDAPAALKTLETELDRLEPLLRNAINQ